jgi:hypothetical protein
MRIVLASLLALTIGSAIGGAQAAGDKPARTPGRWCSIGADNARHCYFKRHQDCMKAISDGSGVCVPNERNRGEMPDDPENNSK